MVTVLGLALVIIASVLFAYGYFAAGLLCGWIMTLLDTVDGKLARVTVQSSRLGHVLDHGLDIVHPPFWYVLWGVGLTAFEPQFGLDHVDLYWLIGLGYIAGRLIEGAFHALGRCSMFAWRPFDAYFRLITARRNPCLIILTIGVACGRADLAFRGGYLLDRAQQRNHGVAPDFRDLGPLASWPTQILAGRPSLGPSAARRCLPHLFGHPRRVCMKRRQRRQQLSSVRRRTAHG